MVHSRLRNAGAERTRGPFSVFRGVPVHDVVRSRSRAANVTPSPPPPSESGCVTVRVRQAGVETPRPEPAMIDVGRRVQDPLRAVRE